MRDLVGVLATVLTLLLLIPGFVLAEDNVVDVKKYGIELQFGGGYYAMEDVNDYVPHAEFPVYMGSDDDKINIGTQFGVGITYRHMENFGWIFGYNRLAAGVPVVMSEKYRQNAYFPTGGGTESWAEQTVSGSELYILPTWYWGWGTKEIMFNIGPAFYNANLDRALSIAQNSSLPNASGSFDNASGTALGFIISGGVELPISEQYYLSLKAGARYANVGEISYEDNLGVEQVVYLSSSSNTTFGVDFSGVFLNLAIHTYFQPSSDWRSPRQ